MPTFEERLAKQDPSLFPGIVEETEEQRRERLLEESLRAQDAALAPQLFQAIQPARDLGQFVGADPGVMGGAPLFGAPMATDIDRQAQIRAATEEIDKKRKPRKE